MDGLHLLGAADTFANQYITIRVKSIDRDQLRYKLGGKSGSIVSSGLSVIDTIQSPKAVLDIATPILKKTAKDYGVDAEISVSNVPPKGGARAMSEFWPGLLIGTIAGGSTLAIVKLIQKLVNRS